MTEDMIETHVHEFKNLTNFRLKGKVTAEQIIAVIEKFYNEKPTRYVLMDFSAAQIAHLATEEIKRIAGVIKKYKDARIVKKTALVFSSDAEFGLGRMFEGISGVEGIPQEYMSFRNVEEAEKWLDEDQ